MDSEQLASVVISQCSSFCLRKGCAMMSYDRGKFILDVRLNVLGNFILCGNCPKNELKLRILGSMCILAEKLMM